VSTAIPTVTMTLEPLPAFACGRATAIAGRTRLGEAAEVSPRRPNATVGLRATFMRLSCTAQG
jgi:hypothetical protein